MFKFLLLFLVPIHVFAVSGDTLSIPEAGQNYWLSCEGFIPQDLPARSAKVTGTVFMNPGAESWNGSLNFELQNHKVGEQTETTRLQQVIFEGSFEWVGESLALHINGADTTNESLDYALLAVVPNGERLLGPYGGFVRTDFGFFKPDYCTLNELPDV